MNKDTVFSIANRLLAEKIDLFPYHTILIGLSMIPHNLLYYLTESSCRVVLQKSISAQIRQLFLDVGNDDVLRICTGIDLCKTQSEHFQ